MMAREIPGHVSFTKLVTVEVLIDRTTATATETHINLVFKKRGTTAPSRKPLPPNV